jgi:hypothetical protein
MKRIVLILLLFPVILFTMSKCRKDFLYVEPNGDLSKYVLADKKGIETLLVGAYSMIDGVSEQFASGWYTTQSNWLWGSVRGLEANKGSDAGDSWDGNPIMNYWEVATNAALNEKWREVYEAISRCNSIINVTNEALTKGTIKEEDAVSFKRQARTLRGWFHFEAWRMWKMIPYIDEKCNPYEISNEEDIRDRIIADLSEGIELPDDMGMIGKFNSTVSKVLLAKAMMQMNNDYAGALPLLEEAINGTRPDGSPIGLAPEYGGIFDIVNRNGIEAVYTVQYSVNDGSGGYNGSAGEVLNFPYKPGGGSPAGCCGFFQPTQEFVNSFRTVDGLPLLDYSYNSPENQILRDEGVPGGGPWDPDITYNKYSPEDYFGLPGNKGCTVYDPAHPFTDLGYVSITDGNRGNDPLTSPEAWKLMWTEDNSRPVDPRLDWTVGRRGIPYWDWGVHTGSDWIRDQSFAGPYSPKKQVYKKSDEGKYTEKESWTTGFTANGYRMIRYADVLLLLAECQIEAGDLSGALQNINRVRERASNPDGYVKESDDITPAATYDVRPYTSFPDREYARKALRMERKLELGMEGHRWFDLNRWGITVVELNRILDYEKTMPWGHSLYGRAIVTPENIYFPVPQRQIDLSNGKLFQNR